MKPKIVVAGGTGDLGGRIVKALVKRGAEVIALVRAGSKPEKVAALKEMGAQIATVDMNDVAQLTDACKGAECVVSALAGLHEVIVEAQSRLLDAAVAAGVPRFIPSDYSTDFTRLDKGDNRNFDLRKEFHEKLDKAAIAPTSIFIGAFADILFYNTPLFDLKKDTVGYWGTNPDIRLEFTTKDNAADYTAAAALDASAPKHLCIASFTVSPNELLQKGKALKHTDFKLVPMGSLEDLAAYNKHERTAHPEGENELYPKWQSSQYMYSMFRIQNAGPDNSRYSDVQWTGIDEVLAGAKQR